MAACEEQETGGGPDAREPSSPSARVLRIRVEPEGCGGRIWRRLELPSWLTLDDLHVSIQAAFAWETRAPYVFRHGDRVYALLDERLEWSGRDPLDAEFAELSDLGWQPGERLRYLRDLASEEACAVWLETAEPCPPATLRPRCRAGEGWPSDAAERGGRQAAAGSDGPDTPEPAGGEPAGGIDLTRIEARLDRLFEPPGPPDSED